MARKGQKTGQDYHDLAKERGHKWCGSVLPKNVLSKTTWRCKEGHKWTASYHRLRGCPYCTGKAPKTKKDYHALAKKHGVKWIGGTLPECVMDKTTWRCKKGHEWTTSYSGLRGCPYCAGKAPKTEKDYHALAKKRGFEWIGETLPENVTINTTWRCKEGHEWPACYNNIQQGRGCPTCYRERRRKKKPLANDVNTS